MMRVQRSLVYTNFWGREALSRLEVSRRRRGQPETCESGAAHALNGARRASTTRPIVPCRRYHSWSLGRLVTQDNRHLLARD